MAWLKAKCRCKLGNWESTGWFHLPKVWKFSKMEKYPPLDINHKSIPNPHHTRVKMSSRYDSCLLSNRNIVVMLPYDT
jgi:hypothetical protein